MSYPYDDSEGYINRESLAFWRFLLSVFVIAGLYFGFIHRFVYMYQYRSYERTSGEVAAVDYLEPEDEDDEISFFAKVEYTVNGNVYRTDLDDGSLGDYIPEKGDEVNILYNKENPSESVVAKKDWLTGALIPMRDKSEISMMLGLFFLIFWGGLVLIFYLGVMPRYAYESKYEDYLQTQGVVTKVEHFENEDPESGNITHSYDVEVEFRLNNTVYRGKSYNYMNGTKEPQEGMQVPILYDGSSPKNAVVVKKDWLTKTMIPADDISDFWLFVDSFLSLQMEFCV